MGTKDFLQEYENKLNEFVNQSIKQIIVKRNLHYNELFKLFKDLRGEFNDKSNFLISEIMNDNNLNQDTPVRSFNKTVQPISGHLFLLSLSIQRKQRERYDEELIPVLEECLHRDYPDYKYPVQF